MLDDAAMRPCTESHVEPRGRRAAYAKVVRRLAQGEVLLPVDNSPSQQEDGQHVHYDGQCHRVADHEASLAVWYAERSPRQKPGRVPLHHAELVRRKVPALGGAPVGPPASLIISS